MIQPTSLARRIFWAIRHSVPQKSTTSWRNRTSQIVLSLGPSVSANDGQSSSGPQGQQTSLLHKPSTCVVAESYGARFRALSLFTSHFPMPLWNPLRMTTVKHSSGQRVLSVFTTLNPTVALRTSGMFCPPLDDRKISASISQPPPRNTRLLQVSPTLSRQSSTHSQMFP
jgi:hypothetical protein